MEYNRQFQNIFKPGNFKVNEHEVYMIKDSNFKRVYELIREETESKLKKVIRVDEDIVAENENLVSSLKTTREMFKEVFDIKRTKNKIKEQLSDKYLDFKRYIRKRERAQRLQKVINATLLHHAEKVDKIEKNNNKDNNNNTKNITELNKESNSNNLK